MGKREAAVAAGWGMSGSMVLVWRSEDHSWVSVPFFHLYMNSGE